MAAVTTGLLFVGAVALTSFNLSRKVQKEILDETIDLCTSIVAEVSSTLEQTIQLSQTNVFTVGQNAVADCGPVGLVMTNSGYTAGKALGNITAEQKNDLALKITDQLQNVLKSKLNQLNKDLNLGQRNIDSNVNEVFQTTKTRIDTNIKQSLSNTVSTTNAANQRNETNVVGVFSGGSCQLTNESVVKLVTQNMVDAAQATVFDAEYLKQISSEIDATTDQTNDGVSFNFTAFIIATLVTLVIITILVVVIRKNMNKMKKS